MSYILLLNRSQITPALEALLDNPKMTLNRDGIRIALKGEFLSQEDADQILADYLLNKESIEQDYALTKKLEKVIENAMSFGRDLIKRYGAMNLKAGKSDEDIDAILEDLADIVIALNSGSLKAAKRKAEAFEPTAAVPQEDVDWFIEQIEKYLDP